MAKDDEKKKNNALSYCRYYKGNDDEQPSGDRGMFFNAERAWVRQVVDLDGIINTIMSDYIAAGLKDFQIKDDTPITLKAVLFNVIGKYTSGGMQDAVTRFKALYAEYYK